MNAKTTSPKMTILGTMKEVALSAETMAAKFQTRLSSKFRLLHLSSHSLPYHSPGPWMMDCLLYMPTFSNLKTF